MISSFLYEVIQISLDSRECLTREPQRQEWALLYKTAQKQTVAGIAFPALDKLAAFGQKPPAALLYEWIGAAEKIKVRNLQLNQGCVEITKLFTDAGFRSCILKGQGNSLQYDIRCKKEGGRCNLSSLRQPGDIDIWIEGEHEDIKRFVLSKWPDAKDGPMHISFQYHDIEVEAHYYAGRKSTPKYNKRLQEWLEKYSDNQFSNRVSLTGASEKEVCVPTVAFNAVYQMSHMMGHFFEEGIGLRHFVDYYFVLKKYHTEHTDITEIRDTVKYLGMEKFGKGVMWILKNCLGLGDEYLFFEPSEKIGKIILNDIEEGGNFGHHDKRYAFRKYGYLMTGIADGYRLIKLAYYFPEESFWKFIRRIENQKWKLKRIMKGIFLWLIALGL